MRLPEPGRIETGQMYRPPCAKCGNPTSLARIELASEPDHDLRTFECFSCNHAEVVKVRFG
jgi:DNA-directed RNA polymerase subunit RPC12/RpoP